MDVKLMLCETCLSSNRQLLYKSTLQSIINDIQFAQLISEDGAVCWECHSIMMKFYKFRRRAQEAQEMLSTSIGGQQIKSLSTLSKRTKISYDYEYTYICDLLVPVESENQVKPIMIKMEDNIDDRLNYDTDYDEKPLSKIFADSIKITTLAKERNRLHKKKSLKQDKKKRKNILNSNLKKEPRNNKYLNQEPDSNLEINKNLEDSKVIFKEKFETVIFTEDEMLKCREEKMNQANYEKIPYKCSSCVTGFTKIENYELHLKKSHDESIGMYICAVCKCRFGSQAAETRHRARHYLQYRCRLCDYKVSSSSAAVSHGRVKHAGDEAGKIHCKLCPFLARSSREVLDHNREVHSLVCDECGVTFKGRHTLRSHLIYRQESSPGYECGHSSPTSHTHTIFTRIHSTKREFSCSVCLKTFTTSSRLESHSACHNNSAAYCTHCRVQYKDIQVYRNHLRNNKNHVEDRIPCPACDKQFASRVYWTKHYNFYHLKRSRYKCEECDDKLFISEWRLKVHRQTQHGAARSRDHACNVCGNTFYSKATLLTHALVHAPRAFMCAVCGAAFTQPAALYTHERIHADNNTITKKHIALKTCHNTKKSSEKNAF